MLTVVQAIASAAASQGCLNGTRETVCIACHTARRDAIVLERAVAATIQSTRTVEPVVSPLPALASF